MEYPLNESSLDRAAGRFQYLYDKYLNGSNRVFLSVIPDKNCFLARESGHLSMDYAQLESLMAQKVGFADYISISDLLERDDYYRTDTHWRQERITDVAERLAQAMGVTLTQNYEGSVLERDFYGVYCGQSALPLAPESIHYLINDAIRDCTVYDYQNNRTGTVYDMERAMGKDPYEMFLSGSLSLITMEILTPKAAGSWCCSATLLAPALRLCCSADTPGSLWWIFATSSRTTSGSSLILKTAMYCFSTAPWF